MEQVEKNQQQELDNLLADLKKHGECRRRSIRAMVGLMGGIGAAWVVLLVLMYLKSGEVDLTTILSQFGLIGCFTSAWGLTQGHQAALKEAEKWQDPALVPHLLEVMDSDSADIKAGAKTGLTHLLPKLQPEHAAAFKPHQIKLLTKLAKDKDAGMAEKAVAALGAVGDKHTLADLDAIAESYSTASKEELKKRSTLALQASGNLRIRLAKQVIDAKSVEVGIDLHKEENRN